VGSNRRSILSNCVFISAFFLLFISKYEIFSSWVSIQSNNSYIIYIHQRKQRIAWKITHFHITIATDKWRHNCDFVIFISMSQLFFLLFFIHYIIFLSCFSQMFSSCVYSFLFFIICRYTPARLVDWFTWPRKRIAVVTWLHPVLNIFVCFVFMFIKWNSLTL